MILSVIAGRKEKVRLIKIGFESPDLPPLDFCLWVEMKSEVYKIKVDTADELLASILDVAGCAKKGGDRLRRTTRHLDTRIAKCVEVDSGILECLL